MKKKLYLLFGLVMSLLLVGVVKAEGPYYKEWSTKKTNTYDYSSYYIDQYQDGYLTVDITYGGALIRIYDYKGNILEEEEFLNKYIAGVYVDGDRILLVEEEYANGYSGYYIREYNNKLAIEKEIQVYEPYYYGVYYYQPYNSLLRIDGDLYYVAYGSGPLPTFLKLEEDLSDYEDFYGEEYTKKLPAAKVETILDSYTNLEYFDSIDLKGNKAVLAGEFIKDIAECREYAPSNSEGKKTSCFEERIIYLNGKNEVFSLDITEDYAFTSEVKFIDDYIVAVVEDYDEVEHILVLDEEGKIVQDIEQEYYVFGIEDTERGFAVNEKTCPMNSYLLSAGSQTKSSVKSSLKEQQKLGGQCKSYHTVYYMAHEIKSEVTNGRGSVEVVSQEAPGAPVTFVVTPDEGYTLGTIKVTDANGNVITFTKNDLNGNTFTMPSADVTIEVEFLVENANTTDVAIMTAAVLAGFAFIMILISKRAIKE